ncbi:hypothetical protein LTR64_002501 [Lithohypha guttulata]|uniref:uncharacterized protein n=1 Tax=Lithohypha guttulata TaxID=1690604 RepID=UPI00315C6DA0
MSTSTIALCSIIKIEPPENKYNFTIFIMPANSSKLTDHQTFALAHSAQCKLNMSARHPDRNLRFLLGHAFLLDKALYRVAEIEETQDSEAPIASKKERLVESKEALATPRQDAARERLAADDEDDTAVDEDAEAGLGLTRFASASEMPPRMVSDEGGPEDEDEGPRSPPSLPEDFDVGALIQAGASDVLNGLYESVRGCPCHAGLAEKSKGFWEIENPSGNDIPKKRLAIMQIEA